jgi:hypothetical protein
MHRMHANRLMKSNIDALLRARGQTRKDLAIWCRKTESWISKIFTEDRREFPMQYFDRIADFFGIATYQLLQPGISPLTERRAGTQRRSGRDRRVSRLHLTAGPRPQLTVALESDEVAAIQRWRLLSDADRQKVDELLREATRRPKRGGGPNTTSNGEREL